MKKVTLLAASVAIALTGCGGGSDSNSNTGGNTGNPDIPAPGGAVVITGFDGYFKNAVLFVDANNNGVWDTSEKALGVTDGDGQVELDEKPEGVLALQTVVPNSAMQQRLIAIDPKEHAGAYTVDMDHPSQPMAHELVFRAPNSSDVISPITDLVAIEMAKDKTKTEEEAKQIVSEALGQESADALYTDFVKGDNANAELHKTAQILTESKAANTSYDDKAIEFAKQADTIVGEMSDDEVKDNNIKPVIKDENPEGDALDPVVITNSKLIVDKTVFDKADALIPASIKENENFGGATVSVENLFTDADQEEEIIPELKHNLAGTGIDVMLSADGKMLTLEPANPVMQPGVYTITLTADDVNSENELVGESSAVFKLEIKANNLAPEVNEAEYAALQAVVDTWYLQQGEAFEQTLSIENLFTDKDGDIVGYAAGIDEVEGLTASADNNAIVTVSGTPTKQYDKGSSITVSAEDDRGLMTAIRFELPEVKEGVAPPPATHPLEGKTWYALEYGSSDGDDFDGLDYSRVWCDSYRFEGKKVYSNERSKDNKNECSAADTLYEGAKYRVEGDMIIATFPGEDNPAETMEVTYKVADDAEYISAGAKVVLFSEQDGNETFSERYTWYSNKADAEARLNIQSEAGSEDRDFHMYIPASTNGTYAEGQVSLQMSDAAGESKVSVFIDTAEGETFTCTDLDEFYRSFNVTADDMDGNGGHYDEKSTCNESDMQGVAIGFHMPDLVVGQKYSIIGKVRDDQGEHIEAIKFNMVWTGTGNND